MCKQDCAVCLFLSSQIDQIELVFYAHAHTLKLKSGIESKDSKLISVTTTTRTTGRQKIDQRTDRRYKPGQITKKEKYFATRKVNNLIWAFCFLFKFAFAKLILFLFHSLRSFGYLRIVIVCYHRCAITFA